MTAQSTSSELRKKFPVSNTGFPNHDKHKYIWINNLLSCYQFFWFLMNFVIPISTNCIKMTSLLLVILFLQYSIFFFDILAQERSSFKGTFFVPTWLCRWHNVTMWLIFHCEGMSYSRQSKVQTKWKWKKMAHALHVSLWSTWTCYLYKTWTAFTDVFMPLF